MKRTRSLIKLSHEHNAGLMLALGLKKNAPKLTIMPDDAAGKAEYAVNFYHTELLPHFREEEEILFPFISGRSNDIDKLIPDLINDHTRLRELFGSIEKDTATADDLADIGDLLRVHIRKEERYLFELIQQHFSDEELESILSKHE